MQQMISLNNQYFRTSWCNELSTNDIHQLQVISTLSSEVYIWRDMPDTNILNLQKLN